MSRFDASYNYNVYKSFSAASDICSSSVEDDIEAIEDSGAHNP